MGAQESLSQEKTLLLAPNLFGAITQNYINVGIDDSLMRYSGKYSTACLEAYSSSLQEELKSKLPDFIEKGGDALAGFSAVPHAVGVGALIISMILQVVFIATNGSQKSGDPSPMDMLRRVFAEEKASEVRDLMEEYLKRYEMHLRDSRRLLADSERLETQLSLQLTRLRNSILLDKKMSSRAVKHWVNGAAFHAQMLVHMARLRKKIGAGTQDFESTKRAAKSAVDTYHRDAMTILERYKEYKSSTFKLKYSTTGCWFTDTDINYEAPLYFTCCWGSADAYLEYIFSNHKQLREIKIYFSNLQKNLEALVNQEGTFQIKP